MDMAIGTGGAGRIDPAILIGMNAKANWNWRTPESPDLLWQPPYAPMLPKTDMQNEDGQEERRIHDRREKQISSLADVVDLGPSGQVTERANLGKYEALSLREKQNLRALWGLKLKRCLGLKDIRKLAVAEEVPLGVSEYSKLAFKQLLSLNVSTTEIFEFLENPALNGPGNLNFETLLRFLESQSMAGKSYHIEQVGKYLEEQTAQGTLKETVLISILKNLSPSSQSPNSIKRELSSSIFRGIQSSAILGMRDISSRTFLALASTIQRVPEHAQVREEMSRAISIRYEIDRKDTLRTLIQYFAPFAVSRHCDLLASSRNLEIELQLLRSLPLPIASHAIRVIISALVEGSGPGDTKWRRKREQWLRCWLDGLRQGDLLVKIRQDTSRQMAWKNLETRIAQMGPEVMATYLRGVNPNDDYVPSFLARCWVQPFAEKLRSKISRQAFPENSRHQKAIGFDPNVLEIDQTTDVSTQYQALISQLRLHNPLLLRSFINQIFPLLRHLHQASHLLGIQRYLLTCKEPTWDIIASEVNQHALHSPSLALELFSSDPRIRLPECLYLARAVFTLSPSVSTTRALRLLLSRANYIHPTRPPNADYVTALHILATKLATAPGLTMRQKLRGVHRVLRLFKGRSDLVGSEIAQAIVQAGLLNRIEMGEKVPEEKLRWVLKVVTHADGAEVAERLDALVMQWDEELRKGG